MLSLQRLKVTTELIECIEMCFFWQMFAKLHLNQLKIVNVKGDLKISQMNVMED